MTSRTPLRHQVWGWMAIAISTGFACLWAWWGCNENFHEGWYSPSIWKNIGLLIVQYLSPMLLVMLVSGAALAWPRLALPGMGICAIAAAWFFGRFHIFSAAVWLIAIPLVILGALYQFGHPEPRRWAWRCLIGLPLMTAIGSGAYPGWMAVHRFDDGNYGIRQISGNGVTLFWAPEGPGWPEKGVSWNTAMENCARLTADGRSLGNAPQNVWRLPTVDESVRSLVFRGENAGGSWDQGLQRAEFRHMPDKDSPLWKVHSKIIYWWTSTEADREHAYYITSNGYVHSVPKRIAPGYLAYRCVAEPPKLK